MAVTVAEMLEMSQAQLHKSFCVAGENLRSGKGRFTKQDFALRTERDYCEGL